MKLTNRVIHLPEVLLILAIILLQACQTIAETTVLHSGKELQLSDNKQTLETRQWGKPCVVPLETSDQCLIKDIDRICMDDSLIFVFDHRMNQVGIFDRQGHLQSCIREIGQGSDEYVQIKDMALNREKKQIIILCGRPEKIMLDRYDGKFIKNIAIQKGYGEITHANQRTYAWTDAYADSTMIDCLDENGTLLSVLTLPHARFLPIENEGYRYSFGKGCHLTSDGEQVFFARPYDNAIYQLKGDSISEAYFLDLKDYNLPPEVLELDWTHKKFAECFRQNRYAVSFLEMTQGAKGLFVKSNQGLFFYDKSTDCLQRYRAIGDDQLGGFSNFHSANGEAKIVTWLPCETFMQTIQRMQEFGKQVGEPYLSVYRQAKEDDNPILIFYAL